MWLKLERNVTPNWGRVVTDDPCEEDHGGEREAEAGLVIRVAKIRVELGFSLAIPGLCFVARRVAIWMALATRTLLGSWLSVWRSWRLIEAPAHCVLKGRHLSPAGLLGQYHHFLVMPVGHLPSFVLHCRGGQHTPERKTVLVFYVGGVTMAEVAALRFLSQVRRKI